MSRCAWLGTSINPTTRTGWPSKAWTRCVSPARFFSATGPRKRTGPHVCGVEV